MKIRVLLLASVLAACTTTNVPENPVEIRGFTFGMVCPADVGPDIPGETKGIGGGTICEETDRILIKGGQGCIFNGEPINCTWYGYEFEYKNLPEGGLNCIWSSSQPMVEGNPEGIRSDMKKKQAFNLEVPAGSGRFYNPLYSEFAPNLEADVVIKTQTICFSGKQKIFEIDHEIIHPMSIVQTTTNL